MRTRRNLLRTTTSALLALALLTGAAACGDDGDDGAAGGDTGAENELTGEQPTATSNSLPVVDGEVQTTTVAPGTVVVTAGSVGDIDLGMTLAQAEATGLVAGAWEPGCELGGPGAQRADLRAPVDGSVLAQDGVVNGSYLFSGFVTSPGGIQTGASLAEVEAAFSDGYSVTVDKSLEEVFEIWSADVTDPEGEPAFSFSIDPATQQVTAVGMPHIPFCE